jgi:hypothetical protein
MSGDYSPWWGTLPLTNKQNNAIFKREDRFISNPAIASLQPTMGGLRQQPKKQFYHKSKMIESFDNLNYHNMLPEDRNKWVVNQSQKNDFYNYTKKSKFFSNPYDGEVKNRRGVEQIYRLNPEFQASQINARERVESLTKDPNTLAVPVMSDAGHNVFEYDPKQGDQVDTVKDSNASYLARRDRFFVPPREGQQEDTLSDIKDILSKPKSDRTEEDRMKILSTMLKEKDRINKNDVPEELHKLFNQADNNKDSWLTTEELKKSGLWAARNYS